MYILCIYTHIIIEKLPYKISRERASIDLIVLGHRLYIHTYKESSVTEIRCGRLPHVHDFL